jgi:hypothetical protein
MLNTPEIAAYDPRPIKLIAMQKKTEIQTAYRGVPVSGVTIVQTEDSGSKRSREKANTVRARACMAVKHTNLIIMNPKMVKAMPPPLPRLL